MPVALFDDGSKQVPARWIVKQILVPPTLRESELWAYAKGLLPSLNKWSGAAMQRARVAEPYSTGNIHAQEEHMQAWEPVSEPSEHIDINTFGYRLVESGEWRTPSHGVPYTTYLLLCRASICVGLEPRGRQVGKT